MAYNLQSLITILQHILNHRQTHLFVASNKPELESLLQKSIYLKQTLENSLESLGSQIRDAAHTAEDIIECHMVDQVDWLSFPAPDLQQVMEEFDSAIKQAVEIVEGKTKLLTGSSSSGAAALLPDHPSSKSDVVGVDEALLQLKDRLTGQESKLGIVPIVGMGGIGKTTLARELYEDNLIAFKFDVRAWTTISQDYNVREVLLGLHRRPNGKLGDELTECALDELKQILYKRLFGKRYLVVLDDMWSTDSWDAIRSCFPNNNNGSRIILTTRHSNVARCVGKQDFQHEVQLMNESQSWDLLHKIVFGEEKCPDAIQEIGRKIASDCGGLPLAINVIGGILSKAERSIDVWEHIANDVRASIAKTSNGELSNVLDLSYNHLPNQLKPCFLYLGAFPEDSEIKGSRLISLLAAEGFAESHRDKSLEEVVEDYLDALVERNLVLVTRKKSNGKALCYGMHDLLRDLCRRKCGEEKFVHVIKNERIEVGIMSVRKVRRVSVHASDYSNGMEDVDDAMPLARSLIICHGGGISGEIVSPVLSVLRLLRVLDVFDVQFKEFPKEVLELVNLRFLALSSNCPVEMPSEISRLLNLQTLIAQLQRGYVGSGIWELPELRHLTLLSCMSIEEGYMKENMQEKKLQTLRSVVCDPSVIRMGFFNTIPNIINLGIHMDESMLESGEDIVADLSHLLKLKTLRCFSNGWRYLARLRFPPSLRKLTVFECLIFPRDWETLCAVPNLEVLKMCECVFEKEVIELDEATEEEDEYVFRSLQFLHLEKLNNLVRWTAYDANFPRLRELILADCPLLEEIPSGIGDISTLQYIQVTRCGPSVEESAKQIRQVQRSENGNYDLQVAIYD